MKTIVVTRHPALITYLREQGIVGGHVTVLSRATADQVRGQHIIGVLPLPLAALAAKVTRVPLDVPAELRGRELSLDEVRKYAQSPITYKVTIVE